MPYTLQALKSFSEVAFTFHFAIIVFSLEGHRNGDWDVVVYMTQNGL